MAATVGSGRKKRSDPTPSELLYEYLSEEQQECLRKNGYFYVVSQDRRVFCVGVNMSRRIVIMYDGKAADHRNVWPVDCDFNYLDKEESMLYMLLWLQYGDPDELLRQGCDDGSTPLGLQDCPPMTRDKAKRRRRSRAKPKVEVAS